MANLFDLPEPVSQPSPTGAQPVAAGPVNLFDLPEPGVPSQATDELEQAAQAGSAALVDYAAKHPELDYDTVFSKYREVAQREQKSLSVVENPTAPLQVARGLAGAVAQIPGSLFRAVKGATGVAAQGLAGDDAQQNAAAVEGVADVEAGTYKSVDALRQAGRLLTGAARANFGSDLSEEDLRKRFDGDLQSMNRINRAVAVDDSLASELAQRLRVTPKELDKDRINDVSEWTDLTMLVPVGFGAKAAEKGVVKGMLRKSSVATVDTALHQLDKLGTEAATKAAEAGATEATQQAVKRSPLLASAIAAGATFATTGDPMWAAISALAGHQIMGKRGLITTLGRKSIRPLATLGAKALDLTKPVYRSAVGGMVGMAPFALSAETPEEFGAFLGSGAGAGVAGGALHFAHDKLTPGSFFRTERVKSDLPKMEVQNFGTDPEADLAHRRAVSWLNNESHNFVETIRQFVKEQTGREVYVLEGADFDRVAADFGKPNRVQGFVTPDGLQSFIRVDNNAFGHESIGHLWFEALDPQSQKEILDGVQKYYRPEEIATFQKEYTDKLANGILLSQRERGEPLNVEAARAEAARVVGSEGYVPREIIAENASAILSSIPPSQFGQPLPFIRGLHLKMEGLAERLGLRNETNTPQTNLGITPSARLANTILNVAAASRLEADMSPDGVVPDMTQASAGNVPDMAQTPPTAAVNPPETTQGMRPVAPAPAETPTTPTPAPVQPAAAPQAAPAAEPAKPGTVEWPVDTGFEPGRAPEPLRPGQPAARPVEKPIPQPVPAAQPPIGENQRRTGAQLNRLIGQNEQLSSAARQDIRTAVEANGGNEAVMANTYAAIQEAVKGGRENTPALRLKMRVAEADAGRINPLTREREQLQRDAGTRGEVVEEKLIVPFGVPQLTKKGTLTFTGFDLSRPFDTADRLFRFAKERGLELPYSTINDPQLTTDLAVYTQNHANGYLGDGRAFPANLAARLEIRPTKGYVPVPISRERSQFLNVLMGNLNTSSERALSTARAVGGQAFQIDPAGTKFETNPLRYRLRELGAPAELLADRNRNSATAVFRLDRIDSVEGATDLGFRQPNTLAVEAGFMPEVFENQVVPDMPLRYRGVWELVPGERMRMFDALKDITDAAGRVLVSKFSTVDSSTLEKIGFTFPELSDEPMVRREYSAFSPAADTSLLDTLDKGEPGLVEDMVGDETGFVFRDKTGKPLGAVAYTWEGLTGVTFDRKLSKADASALLKSAHEATNGIAAGEYPPAVARALTAAGFVDTDGNPIKAVRGAPKAETAGKPAEVSSGDAGRGRRVVELDTPAGEQESGSLPFARAEGALGESIQGSAPLKLIHWSGNAGLERLDPAKFGSAHANSRDLRGDRRVYFFEQGSEYGADEGLVTGEGKYVYGATISRDRIYDGDSDALGYYEQLNRAKADALLKKNGYVGIATSTPDGRKVVEMYEPVDVKPLKKDSSRFAPEKLPTKKAAEENIKRWNLSPEEAAAYRDFLDSQGGLDGATLPAELVTDPDGRPGFNTEDGATTIRVRNLRYDLIQAPEIRQLRDRYQREYDTKRTALEETRKAAPRDRKAALERRIAALDSWWETEGQNRWVEEGTDLLADRLTEEYHKSEKDPEVQAGIGWYSKMRTWLQKRFGAGIEQFSQLLGATSAQTPVDENFRQALDALTRLSRGDYDPLLQKFDEHVKKAEAEFPDDSDAFRKQVLAFDEFPTRSNGKKFNANSTKVLYALYGNWLELSEGPKTPNFAGNLSGRTTAPTIDVWAARTAHRLLYENKSYNPETGRIGGKATRWRLQPSVEAGVEFRRRLGSRTGGDFFFAQDAYRKAADRLGIAGDDLQAFMWFHEKDNWEKRGWTSKVGAKKSSFEEEAGKLDLDRYQSGVTTFTTPELHNSETFQKTLADLRDTIAGTEGLRYGRAQESKGLYGGVEEPTFDVEFVLDQGADPTGILRKVVDIGRSAEQYDVFVSRAVDPDHPNARPGLEIGFRKPQTWDFVKSITGALSAKGVDGFTVASDRRGRPIGVRAQYVPEITARWTDSSPLEVANFHKNAILWTEKAQSALASLSDDLQSEISYSNPTAFDTRVYGREEYSGAAKIQWGETRLEKELGRRKEVLAAARK